MHLSVAYIQTLNTLLPLNGGTLTPWRLLNIPGQCSHRVYRTVPHLLGNAKELSLHKGTLQKYTDGLFISSAVTGKTKSDFCWVCFLHLTFASHCFCSLKGYCLYIMVCLREHSLSVKPKCLCLEKHPDLWPPLNSCKKEDITTSSPRAWLFRRYLGRLITFYFSFNSSAPPHLCSIKETGIQALIRYIFKRLVCHISLVCQLE